VDPTLDGENVFVTACHVQHVPGRLAIQLDSHFGVSDIAALVGGTRGRTFHIQGVFVGEDLPTCVASEALLLGFMDGLTHTFTDTQGREWPNVMFEGEYQTDPGRPHITDFGWAWPFRCTLVGLS
jgi:hypothetical protein